MNRFLYTIFILFILLSFTTFAKTKHVLHIGGSCQSLVLMSNDSILLAHQNDYIVQYNAANGNYIKSHKIQSKSATALCVSPDGSKMAFKDENNDLTIMDFEGSIIKKMDYVPGISIFEFSQDGQYFYYYNRDIRYIIRYNLKNDITDTLNQYRNIYYYAIDFEKGIAASLVKDTMNIVRITDNSIISRVISNTPNGINFPFTLTHNGDRIAINRSSSLIELYDIHTGQLLKQFNINAEFALNKILFSPDDKWIIAVEKNGIHLINMEDENSNMFYYDETYDFSYSPVITKDNKYLYYVHYGYSIYRINLHDKSRTCITASVSNLSYQFNQDGSMIINTDKDSIIYFNTSTGKQEKTYHGLSNPANVFYNYDGSLIVSTEIKSGSASSELKIWDEKTGNHLRNCYLKKSILKLIMSPKNNYAAYYDGEYIRVVDLNTGDSISKVEFSYYDMFEQWMFSHDGTQIVFSEDSSVSFFDIKTGKVVKKLKLNGFVTSISLCPDGRTIVYSLNFSPNWPNDLYFYDIETGSVIKSFKATDVYNIKFNDEGDEFALYEFSYGQYSRLKFYSYPELNLIKDVEIPNTDGERIAFKFMLKKEYIIYGSAGKTNYTILNYLTGESFDTEIPGNSDIKPDFKKYAFSANNLLFINTIDTIAKKKELMNPVGYGGGAITWSADKSKLCVNGDYQGVYILNALTGEILDSLIHGRELNHLSHNADLSEFMLLRSEKAYISDIKLLFWKPKGNIQYPLINDFGNEKLYKSVFSPNNKLIAILGEKGIHVLNVDSLEQRETNYYSNNISKDANFVWLNDSSEFAYNYLMKINLLKLSGDIIKNYETIIAPDNIKYMAYNRKRNYLACSFHNLYRTILIYDLNKPRPIKPFVITAQVSSMSFSSYGDSLFVDDGYKHYIFDCDNWELLNYPEQYYHWYMQGMMSFSTSPDGLETAFSYSESPIWIRNNDEYNTDMIIDNPSGRFLGTDKTKGYIFTLTNNQLKIYDDKAGKFIKRVMLPDVTIYDNTSQFKPDHMTFLSSDNNIFMAGYWVDLNNGTLHIAENGYLLRCFTNDAKYVIGSLKDMGYSSGKIPDFKIWDRETGNEVMKIIDINIRDLSGNAVVSSDNRLLIVGGHERIYLWNLQSGKLERIIENKDVGVIEYIIFNDKLNYLICSSVIYIDTRPNKLINIIDFNSGKTKERIPVSYHNSLLSLSTDGTKFLSASIVEGLDIWEFDTTTTAADSYPINDNQENGFVYPNPVSGNLRIKLNESLNPDATVSIYNLEGMEVCVSCAFTIESGSNVINIETSSLTTGIYFVKLMNAGNMLTFRVIKE